MEFKKKEIKLFILSGKARSGKDTVASIIKDYYSDKKTIIVSFGHYIKDYAKRVSNWDGSEETKPRELLQQIGIELIKNKIDDKLFINRVFEDIEVFSYFYDIIIVSDARLIDEVSDLKSRFNNSISIRINRINYSNSLTEEENKHLTEVELDNYYDFDYIIENDNIVDLKDKVEQILKEC